MTTVVVFDAPNDLAATETGEDEITLSWSPATPLYQFQNGGAENGMTGWTSTLGAWFADGAHSNQMEGDFVFHGGPNVARSLARQRISPLSAGLTFADLVAGRDITLTWWAGNSDTTASDDPRINLYFYDETETLLDSYVPAYRNPPVSPMVGEIAWLPEIVESTNIPAGTCFIDVEIDGLRVNGTSCDALIDDIRITLELAQPLPYVPGYAIYRDDVLIATTAANAVSYVDSGLAAGRYTYKIVVSDGTNFLSDASNEIEHSIGEQRLNLSLFDDERVFGGYFGGRLRGKVVACPGSNVNKSKARCC